nr:MAG TPA: hypothetical protein [Caudoviricetes sp.]
MFRLLKRKNKLEKCKYVCKNMTSKTSFKRF